MSGMEIEARKKRILAEWASEAINSGELPPQLRSKIKKGEALSREERETFRIHLDNWISNGNPSTTFPTPKVVRPTNTADVESACRRYGLELTRLRDICVTYCGLLAEWIDFRLSAQTELTERRAEMNARRNKLMQLEAQIINVQLKRVIYDGKSFSVRDYTEHRSEVERALRQYSEQIAQFKRLLKMDSPF